jgi:hypothetical protein
LHNQAAVYGFIPYGLLVEIASRAISEMITKISMPRAAIASDDAMTKKAE